MVPTRSWWRAWLAVTCLAAVVVTGLDAALLQQRRSFFTGGFLAVDHITHPSQAVAFLGASLLIDGALLGMLAAVALWACARAGLSWRAALVAAGAAAAAPVLVANVIEYQLIAYFGDTFDLGLMFELTGRRPDEILAVSSPQLLVTGGAIVLAAVAAGMAVKALARRRGAPRRAPIAPLRGRTVAALVAVLLAAGALGTLAARTRSDVLDNGVRRKPSGRFLSGVVNTISDVDRDGFGVLGRPPDPDLFDARVHPYALEIPGNGIDENGIGGDLPLDVTPYVEASPGGEPWPSRPDVVLIVLESFRADARGATLHGRPVTPVLDALAAHGVAAAEAYSHNGYTVQSRRHIFSGSTADLHGATTLLDDFASRGYLTAYFSAQDESFGGPNQSVGFERADVSYDARVDQDRRYSSFSTPGSLAVSHEVLHERVSAFLQQPSARPLFLYVNFHDTHFPYHHEDIRPIVSDVVVAQRDISPGRAVPLREMYLNTAANVDRAIGRLLGEVREARGREPGVIVLSDHGESLFEEGFLGHGYTLDAAQTRIPLIVSGLPVIVREPFGQADLRGLLHEALSGDVPGPARPRAQVDPSKRVFQYLGNIDRPGQIAFVTGTGRITYDLRGRLARIGDGPWVHEQELAPDDRAAVLELIHTWERMMRARAGGRR